MIAHKSNDPIPVAANAFAPKRLTMAISARFIITRLKLLNIMGIARIMICLDIDLSELSGTAHYIYKIEENANFIYG